MKTFIFVIALSILMKVCTCTPCSPMNLKKDCVNWANNWRYDLTEMEWSYGNSNAFWSIDNNAFIDFPALNILKFENKGDIRDGLISNNFKFGLKKLTNLQLKNNNIYSIPMYCFIDLEKLAY